MARKYKRVAIYPSDLKKWSGKSDSAVYRDYSAYQVIVGINKELPLTIFHFRDMENISLDDVVDGFGLGCDSPET